MIRAAYTPCQDCDKVDSKTCEICEMALSRRPIGHWEVIRHPMWRGYRIQRCSICGWVNEKSIVAKFCPMCGMEADE